MLGVLGVCVGFWVMFSGCFGMGVSGVLGWLLLVGFCGSWGGCEF